MKISSIKKVLKEPNKIIPYLRNRVTPSFATKSNSRKSTYSDIFIWRSQKEWNTFYDFIPYIDLIENQYDLRREKIRRSRLLIFSKKGKIISEVYLEFKSFEKFEVNISDHISSEYSKEKYGTFMIFHDDIPSQEILGGGSLTDRGYISYGFNGSLNHSYAHGNLDAVSSEFDSKGIKSFTFFKSTILKRKFNLQYLFKRYISYELGLTNPTKKEQIIYFYFHKTNGEKLKKIKKIVSSLGVTIFELPLFEFNYFISIKSNLPMARPLIFKKINNNFIDVFHG